MSKNIIIQTDHWANIMSLSKEQAGELIQACISEAKGEEYHLTSQAVVNVFEPMRRAIKHRREHEAVKDKLLDAVEQEALRLKIKKSIHLKFDHKYN